MRLSKASKNRQNNPGCMLRREVVEMATLERRVSRELRKISGSIRSTRGVRKLSESELESPPTPPARPRVHSIWRS